MAFFKRTLLCYAVGLAGGLCSIATHAEFVVQANTGLSMPQSSGYDDSSFANLSLGYESKGWRANFGYMRIGEFKLDENDANVESEGWFISGNRVFELNSVNLELGLGLGNIISEADYEGRQVGEDKSTVPFLECMVVKELGAGFGVSGGFSYFSDVSGSNIVTAGIGVRYSF